MLEPYFDDQQVAIEKHHAVALRFGGSHGRGFGNELAPGNFLQVFGRVVRAGIGQVLAGKLRSERSAIMRGQPGSERRFAR